MRNLLLPFAVLFLLPWLTLAQSVKIDFHIEGMGSQEARIIGMMGNNNFLVDSLQTDAEGKVSYTATKLIAGGLYYFVYDQNKFFQILIDKDQVFSMTTKLGDHINSMVVEGSLDNQLFYQNLKYEEAFKTRLKVIDDAIAVSMVNSKKRKELEAEKQALIDERIAHISAFKTNHPNSFFTIFKIAGQNPELTEPKKPDGTLDTLAQVFQYRKEYWDNVDLHDERLLRTPVIYNKMKTYITTITDQKADSVIKSAETLIAKAKPGTEMFKFIVNYVALEYRTPKIMGMDAVFVHMIQKYWKPEIAFWSNQQEIKNLRNDANFRAISLLGKTGPNLKCKSLDGSIKELYSLKGPVRLIYMWSYTCEHCRERSPVLREVYDKWHEKGLDVYSLCLDDDEAKWKEAATKYKMDPYTNVIDADYSSGYLKKYHVDITPELYVLDKDWKIVAKDLHPNQLEPTLKKLLGN